MKKLVYAIGVAGFMVSCSGSSEETTSNESNKDTASQEPVVVEEPPVENSFVLEAGVVGVFKIGQPVSRLPEELKSRKAMVNVTNKDGVVEEHVQYVIFNSLEDVVEVTVEKDDAKHEEDLAITDMRVISNYYETKDGIRVGETVSLLTEKYPDTKFRYVGSTGEIIGESATLVGMQFVIDPAACTKKVSGTKDISLSAKNFNEEAKIKYIRVY